MFADSVMIGELVEESMWMGMINKTLTIQDLKLVCYTQPQYQAPQLNYQNKYKLPHSNFEKKPPKIFTLLDESRTCLFERLHATGLIQIIDPKSTNMNAKHYRSDQHCAYNLEGIEHTIENYINLKNKIQD